MGTNKDRYKYNCVPNVGIVIDNHRTINCNGIIDVKYSLHIDMNRTNEVETVPSEVISSVKVTSRSANTLFLLLRISEICRIVVKKWMLFLVLLSCANAYKEQRFAIEPQDQVSVFQ